MRLKLFSLLALSTLALTACEKVKAPRDAGVCYFIGHPRDGSIVFNVISRDEPNIEHCAARLYNARMDMLRTGTAGDLTEGSYQGSFLFVDNREIKYAKRYEGPGFPLLVKAPDGRLVAPGAVVEEDDAPTGPVQVEVPKNLPKTK